jgi:elongation factor G
VVDVKVVVTDGKHHPVDSKEVAFVAAGHRALLAAVQEARPVVMEPVVNLEVQVPQDAMGSVTGDLAGRRGKVLGTRSLPLGRIVVMGQAPLAELDDYPERLKAMTGGSATFTLEMAGYEKVPDNIQRDLTASFKHQGDDD